MASSPSPTHARGLGPVLGTALIVASVLGPGILGLPALAYARSGPAFLVALGGILIMSVFIALTFAFLGRRGNEGSDIAGYVRSAFGARGGAIVGYWFYFGVTPGMAALGLIAGEYVRGLIGGGLVTVVGTAAILLAVATLGSLAGVRLSAGLQLILTGTLLVLLWLAVTLALPAADASHLHPFAPEGWGAILPAALILVWFLTGWEAAANLTGLLRDPRRRLLPITVAALVILAATFAAVCLVMVLALGPAATEGAPIGAMLAITLGPAGPALGAVTAVILTLGNMNAYLASLVAVGGTLAREGLLPSAGRVMLTAIPVGLTVLALAAAPLLPQATELFVSLSAASQIPVLLIGSAAGLMLLPRRSAGRSLALGATVSSALLLAVAGWYLLAPLLIAGIALLAFRRRGAPA
ncbi:APC family permease [Mycetocola spongiae]|uniref:APC family permease n=1 Tax=Mycetocola spongiae TaxID=2859226 RepID=UPI001CF27D7D|nr:amino acid permease [Mycetocola spongiae]UCR88049.1 amino acid permease [Mycetocola spongiae]